MFAVKKIYCQNRAIKNRSRISKSTLVIAKGNVWYFLRTCYFCVVYFKHPNLKKKYRKSPGIKGNNVKKTGIKKQKKHASQKTPKWLLTLTGFLGRGEHYSAPVIKGKSYGYLSECLSVCCTIILPTHFSLFMLLLSFSLSIPPS